jgi:selenide,water dikinase
MLADSRPTGARLKSGLRAGDKLMLTKPLGSGILLAAHMRQACQASWMQTLVTVLVTSNQAAAAIADESDVSGVTDVTGFGLAGHLLEMLRASGAGAEIDLSALPLLPGVLEALADGIESTLAPANRAAEAEIEWLRRTGALPLNDARYATLFDPQTSGGLLLGVREAEVDAYLSRLAVEQGLPGTVIGTVVERTSEGPLLRVL